MANQRPNLNFILGAGVSIALADNPALNATDVTIGVTAAASIPTDGWVAAGVTWTYASFTAGPPAVGTFTVAGDLTALFSVGTRIKLTQTTVKYFVVTASSHAAGTTTVSITGGTDYTLANAAITAPYYSYVVNPQGYPGWFNCAHAATGFSPAPTVSNYQFAAVGRVVTFRWNITGTSNATTFTAAAPILPVLNAHPGIVVVTDNGTAAAGRIFVSGAAGAEIVFGATPAAAGGFTNSGTKGSAGIFVYGI